MFGQPCQYDSGNYDHHCVYLGRPCEYVGRINNCPILQKEKEMEEKRRLGQR